MATGVLVGDPESGCQSGDRPSHPLECRPSVGDGAGRPRRCFQSRALPRQAVQQTPGAVGGMLEGGEVVPRSTHRPHSTGRPRRAKPADGADSNGGRLTASATAWRFDRSDRCERFGYDREAIAAEIGRRTLGTM